VYNLDGSLIPGAGIAGARMNNADVRYGFPMGGQDVDIVAATNRTSDSIDFFTIDPNTRSLAAAGSIDVGATSGLADDFDDPYGIALYRSPRTGSFYAFISEKSGDGLIGQFELTAASGQIGGSLVRTWKADDGRGTHLTEGLVVDDHNEHLFVGEETTAIYRYGAEPTDGTTPADRVTVDTMEKLGGHLVADVEGLALFQTISGAGYLLASSQGNSEFAIYDRQSLAYLGSFDLRAVSGFVNRADGIDVLSTGLGSHFPSGIFVAQHDDQYALTSWDEVVTQAASAGIKLARDSSFDPRSDSAILLGDMDLDGGVDFDDVAWLVTSLTDPIQYENLFGIRVTTHGDTDLDGDYDFDDIHGFVAILTAGGGDQLANAPITVPEPSIGGLAGLGLVGLLAWAARHAPQKLRSGSRLSRPDTTRVARVK
jgi:3-phytase